MKKAQVTIFILISIVLLAAFLLLFNLSQNIAETKSRKTADMVYSDILQKTPLTKYIERCIDMSAKNSIKIISEQGGFFFKNQPGSMIDWDIPYITKDDKRIAYQIYPPNPFLVERTSLYPCYTPNANVPPIMVGDHCYENYDHSLAYYIFGSTGEPEKGINPDLCEAYNYSRAGYECFCEECTGYSIETQLENFIENEIKDCVNLEDLTTYNVSRGNISVDVLIGNEDVTINLKFPLVIKIKGFEAETKFQGFSITLPIRLKVIYDTARTIINKEINDISFNLIDDAYNLRIPYLDYKIEPIPEDIAYLYTITDSKSQIEGKDYVFQFAIKNRQPALNYYNPDNCYIDGKYYHLCAIEGEEIIIEPIAYDPDDHILFHKYSGWKADYDTIFTTTANNPTPHQENINITTNILHSSTSYLETNRNANIQTAYEDIGPHTFTLTVIDFYGLKDTQEIDVMIDDRQNVYFFGQSPYSDIPQDVASLEDPFVLDASSTTDYFEASNLLFRWEIADKEFDYSYANVILDFPMSIGNINAETKFSQTTGSKLVTLKAKSTTSSIGQYEKEIQVYECLPHRSDAAPFPFYNYPYDTYPDPLNNDPLQANHACCSDGTDGANYGSIISGNCYELIDYGCIFHFNSSDTRHIDPSGIIRSQNINPTTSLSSTTPIKELFKRELKVTCSNRGNICNGPVQVFVTSTGTICPTNCAHSLNETEACR